MPDTDFSDNQQTVNTQGAKTPEDQKLIDEARKRFDFCADAEKDIRDLAQDDLKFRAGEQWPEDMKIRRKAARKPCLTINVLPARERQILNDNRQNRPAIQVNPVDDGADEDTAEVLQGIIRHIEYDSHADVAYDTALAWVVRTGGPGWIRLLTEYESPTSLKQVIKIKRVVNPFQVYCDPTCTEADYSDAKYVFYFEPLTKQEFKQQYPGALLADLDDWRGVADKDPAWLSEDGIRVCEYFYIDNEQDTVVKLRNKLGDEVTMLESEMEDNKKRLKGYRVVDSRETEVPKVKWCKFTAYEVLDREEWIGKYIPWVPVLGDELFVDGKRVYEGMVRHAKDPMRMNNVMKSELVTAIGLAPKAPFIAAAGQTENYPEWQTANTEMYSVLVYSPKAADGSVPPPPQRNAVEPPIQAMTEASIGFQNDLRDVTGIHEAEYGAPSNEKSGKAIAQRRQQGEISNFHFADNLGRSLRFLGLQLIDLIPRVYDEPTVMRIVGEDGTQKVVKVNQQFTEGGTNPVKKIYDLTTGTYDVTVSTGPSYQTKRQEAVATMLDIRRGSPNLPPIYDDLIFQNMDFPGHEQMAERARKALPPQLLDDGKQDPEAQVQQLRTQLQTVLQQHELMTQQLNKAMDVIHQKQVEANAKVSIAKIDSDTKIAVAEITTKAQMARERFSALSELESDFHGQAHELALQKDQQVADAQQAQMQHQQALELGQQQAVNTSAQSAQDAAQQSDLQASTAE